MVIWGAGSKGVAFLTTLGFGVEFVEFAVDINPHRAGFFMPGTGQRIIGPGDLLEHEPDVVIIMNPVYEQEIKSELGRLDISPEVLTV